MILFKKIFLFSILFVSIRAVSFAEDVTDDVASVVTSDVATVSVSEPVPLPAAAEVVGKAEADIPVLTSVKSVKSASGLSSFRVIMGFVIIFSMSAGLILFSRWFAKRNRRSKDPSRIQIVSQQFLGTNKSLAIVRVAGESILVGVTDHNITMIKALAMLEDEEAETGISSFKNTLMSAQNVVQNTSTQKQPEDLDYATQTVTDKITTKMKGMRSI